VRRRSCGKSCALCSVQRHFNLTMRNLCLQKKARASHNALAKLTPLNDLPLYNQPSDTDLYHENKRRWVSLL
jgi:hypothetical protein